MTEVKNTEFKSERSVKVRVSDNHDNPSNSTTFYNEKMKINREFVLVALMTHVKQAEGQTATSSDRASIPVKCLDAFAATGMAGFQWKKHLKEKITLTSNEKDEISYAELKRNAELNEFKHDINAEGDLLKDDSVELLNKDCNIVMYERQFNFIHLDPFGTSVQYLEAAFRNIYNKGVVVVTSTDIASLLGKCEQVTLRNYGAYNTKCDYRKEVAVRILIAALARAAAHCHKGIKVLYSVYLEHFVQVAVRVERGAQKANACVTKISKILHCQQCHEFSYVPHSLAPIEKPYDLLRCDCNKEMSPSKTAVLLGPLWSGLLHDTEFVMEARLMASKHKLSERLTKNLEIIHQESKCYADDIRVSTQTGESIMKRVKMDYETSDNCPEPMFYFSLQERKLQEINIPKIQKLKTLLNCAGFYASPTNFERQSIRTNASLKQITDILNKFCRQKSLFCRR